MKGLFDVLNKLGSPLANVLGIVSFFGITGTSYLFLFDYYREIIIFILLVVVVVFWFIVLRYKKLLDPIDQGIANVEIYRGFFDKEKELFIRKIDELRSGHMRVLGEDVRRTQVGFMAEIAKLPENERTIQTVDLTTSPELWLSDSRKRYFTQNRQFVREQGGKVERILLIDEEKLNEQAFRDSLDRLIAAFEEIPVYLGLEFKALLEPRQLQDFIVYGNFAILVEEKQADSEYKLASSMAHFRGNDIREYKSLFGELWLGKNTSIALSAVEILRLYKRYFAIDSGQEKKDKEGFLEYLRNEEHKK